MRFFLFLAFLITSSCSSKNIGSLLEEARAKFHAEIAKEYGVHLIEERIHQKGEIQRLRLTYEVYEDTDVLQARFLIHRITETLLTKISAIEKNYRVKNRVSEKDVEITVSFINRFPKKQYPFIEVTHVSLLQGWIHYTRYQPNTGEIELIHREEFTSLLAPLLDI